MGVDEHVSARAVAPGLDTLYFPKGLFEEVIRIGVRFGYSSPSAASPLLT